MATPIKIAFAFMPQKATEKQVDDYLQDVKKAFPDSVAMISALRINGYIADINKPFLNFATSDQEKLNLLFRYYLLLERAMRGQADYLFANLGILRYPFDVFADFVRNAIHLPPSTHLIIAEPLIDMRHPGLGKALENVKIRQRLLTDSFINFFLSETLHVNYANINAGMFGIRLTREVLRALRSTENDEDTSLVCPRIYWRLRGAETNFEIRKMMVDKIDLQNLGFSAEKAISEINYIYRMSAKTFGGDNLSVMKMADDFFSKCEFIRHWAGIVDREWFIDRIALEVKKTVGA